MRQQRDRERGHPGARAWWPLPPRQLGYVGLVWGMFALVRWVLSLIAARSTHGAMTVLCFDLVHSTGWALFTLLAFAWLRLLRPFRSVAGIAWPAHLIAVVWLSIADAILRRSIYHALHIPTPETVALTMLFYVDLTIVSYGAIVVMANALEAEAHRVRQLGRELALRAQVARAHLEYLDAQLQPHFLFNALGTIGELAHEAPASAARMLRQLGAVLRFAISDASEMVPLTEELAALEPYLDIQRIRFSDWLVIQRDIALEALDVIIPRLTLQPLVENALRHGLRGRTQRGVIRISASVHDGRLHLTVADNGRGLLDTRSTKGFGVGLANLRERLANVYEQDFTFTMGNEPTGGTVVSVSVPVEGPKGLDATGDPASGDTATGRSQELALAPMHPGRMATGLAWVAWGTIWTQQSLAYRTAAHGWTTSFLARDVLQHGIAVVLWAVMASGVPWITRAIPLSRAAWSALAHITIACAFALVHAGAWQLLTGGDGPLWAPNYLTTMLWSVLLYGLLVGMAHYRDLAAWLRERETEAARLRAELMEAQVNATALSFQPQAVLRALDDLASRVECDPRGADRSLSLLAEQLRADLEVTLRPTLVSHASALTRAACE